MIRIGGSYAQYVQADFRELVYVVVPAAKSYAVFCDCFLIYYAGFCDLDVSDSFFPVG